MQGQLENNHIKKEEFLGYRVQDTEYFRSAGLLLLAPCREYGGRIYSLAVLIHFHV